MSARPPSPLKMLRVAAAVPTQQGGRTAQVLHPRAVSGGWCHATENNQREVAQEDSPRPSPRPSLTRAPLWEAKAQEGLEEEVFLCAAPSATSAWRTHTSSSVRRCPGTSSASLALGTSSADRAQGMRCTAPAGRSAPSRAPTCRGPSCKARSLRSWRVM